MRRVTFSLFSSHSTCNLMQCLSTAQVAISVSCYWYVYALHHSQAMPKCTPKFRRMTHCETSTRWCPQDGGDVWCFVQKKEKNKQAVNGDRVIRCLGDHSHLWHHIHGAIALPSGRWPQKRENFMEDDVKKFGSPSTGQSKVQIDSPESWKM